MKILNKFIESILGKSSNRKPVFVFFYFYRQYRYTAYYQYTSWTHYFEILGRDKRVVIPSCVVKEIKNTFPESIGGKYTGFKRASLSN